ncbi:hypothetical protein Tco_0765931 [Tanacetum coccineum]
MQYSVVHQPPQEETSLEFLQDKRNLINSVQTFLRKFNRFSFYEMPKVVSLAWETISEIEHAFEDKQYQSEGILELFRKLHNDVQNIHEELAEYINTPSWNRPTIYYDDDDDDEDYTIAITPDLPITDSLIMEDEHLDSIPTTESDELIKSSVESLVQILSESEYLSDGECDLPLCDDSPKSHLTFFNPLFNIDDDFTSSDDESFSRENVPMENFKIFSNPLFDLDEEIRNTLMASSLKIDSLLDEFAGELTLLKSIPPRINDDNLDPEGEIHLVERLLYDNSFPCPPKELNVENSIETFSPSLIPVEDSDSFMEEIDLFLASDGSIPLGIESDDYDSEYDDNSTSLPEFESFHVDYPDSGDSTIDVVEDIPVDVPNILPTHPTLNMDFDFIPSHNDLRSNLNDLRSNLDVSSPSGDRNKIYNLGICIEVESTRFLATHSPMIDTLLPFSSENKDKVFNHGVLASKEKSLPS